MELEIRRRGTLALEAVVLDEAVELRPRDVRLPGLDRVEDPERLERILGRRPGGDARRRLGETGGTGIGVESPREAIPQLDVRALLVGVLGAGDRGSSAGRVGERDDGVPVFPR